MLLGFVFTCLISVSCSKGHPLSMRGRLLFQQDMGLIMKNSKASVQVSDGSAMYTLSVYSSYCVLAESDFCFFCFSFSSTHLIVFLFQKQPDTKILWPGLNAFVCVCFIINNNMNMNMNN